MNKYLLKAIAIILVTASGRITADWTIMESSLGGYAASAASNNLPLIHSVHYSPNFECKPIYSYLTKNFGKETGNQKTGVRMGLQVDNGIIYFAPAGQDVFLTEKTIAVYIPISESNLPGELKRGNKLILRASDEKVIAWVSLKGSTKGMNEAKQKCMEAISPSQSNSQNNNQKKVDIITAIPDFKNIEGLWVPKDQDPNSICAEEDSPYRIAIGRWEVNNTIEFGKGSAYRLGFWDGGCEFFDGKQQGSTFILKSECGMEDEEARGDTIITVISPSDIQVINPLTEPLTLVRCPQLSQKKPKPAMAMNGEIPEEYIGDWVPISSGCSSPNKFRITSKAAMLVNGQDNQTFDKIDLCYSCEGNDKYEGNVIWLTPESDNDNRVPFIAYLNAGEKMGVTVVDIDNPELEKRFHLDGLELKKCK